MSAVGRKSAKSWVLTEAFIAEPATEYLKTFGPADRQAIDRAIALFEDDDLREASKNVWISFSAPLEPRATAQEGRNRDGQSSGTATYAL